MRVQLYQYNLINNIYIVATATNIELHCCHDYIISFRYLHSLGFIKLIIVLEFLSCHITTILFFLNVMYIFAVIANNIFLIIYNYIINYIYNFNYII